MKKQIVRLLFVCSLAGGLAACEFSGADDIPSQTAPGWQLFDYVDGHIGRSLGMVRTAYRFNEYYKQTTDEGRWQMLERYFPKHWISGGEDGWTISNARGSVWRIVMSGRLPLEEQGAQWVLSYKENPDDDQITVSHMTVINSEGTGCSFELGPVSELFTERAWWRVTAESGESLRMLSIEGSGTLEQDGSPSMRVSYEIVSPLVYIFPMDDFVAGKFQSELSISGRMEISAEAEYAADKRMQLTYNGKTEWRTR